MGGFSPQDLSPASPVNDALISFSPGEVQQSPSIVNRIFPIRSVISKGTIFTAADQAHSEYVQHQSPTDNEYTPFEAALPSFRLNPACVPACHSPSSPPTVTRSTERTERSDEGDLFSTQDVRSTKSPLPQPLVREEVKETTILTTGRGCDTIQWLEDAHLEIPGSIQGFGLFIALEDTGVPGVVPVSAASENSKLMIGKSPTELFALHSFLDIFTEDQARDFIDRIDCVKDRNQDLITNGPDVFLTELETSPGVNSEFWCALHLSPVDQSCIVCEFELKDSRLHFSLSTIQQGSEDSNRVGPNAVELNGDKSGKNTEEYKQPLDAKRNVRKRRGYTTVTRVLDFMSRTEEALAAAPKLKVLSEELASIVKELTGHHHVMIHQFDKLTESHVIAEVADHNVPKANRTELHARALELPRLARSLHSTNRVRALYDRDQKPLRLIGRSGMDSRAPLDLTNSYLRTMSPIHMAYLKNLDVRSTMSATIGTTDNVWGLIVCFSYGSSGMPTSFQTRKICQFVSKVASRNLERLLNKSRLQNWDKIIGAFTSDQLYQHVETPHQLDRQRPRTSPANLLRVFRADFAILSTGEQTRIIGQIERLPEALVILEYFRLHRAESATTSINIERDFPDIQYPFRFKDIAGIFVVPLSHADSFFIFFRRAFPSSKTSIPSATNSSCRNDTMPLAQTEASPETDPDLLIRTCNPWTEADLQTAHVLRLVSGNLLHTWEKDDANHLKRLLIENSAHELRTPLNAVINYLEIAMEGTLEPMIWANLNKSYSASQSLLGATSALLADWNSY